MCYPAYRATDTPYPGGKYIVSVAVTYGIRLPAQVKDIAQGSNSGNLTASRLKTGTS